MHIKHIMVLQYHKLKLKNMFILIIDIINVYEFNISNLTL
jgi:hypothetical protein